MPLILNLETSTQVCSVALASGKTLVGQKESFDEKSHSRKLSIFIRDILQENSLTVSDLDAIAVSIGPGSYTGLRIGVSTAKGLAYGIGIPIIAIGTLNLLAAGGMHNKAIKVMVEMDKSTLLCPMIDARRMEVYAAIFSPDGSMIKDVAARIIDKESYREQLESGPMVFFGNGAEKCQEEINHSNATFIAGIEANAKFMLPLSFECWQQKKFENVAYFEPFYLKDFIATVPKNRIVPGISP